MNRMATNYNPFEEMTRMIEGMRTAFWDLDDGFPYGRGADAALPSGATRGRANLDLTEHDGEFVLSADLPGFEIEEISLTLDEGLLTITAEHEDDGETVSRSRRVYERVTIPKPVDEDDISATYRNGVLTVRMPVVGEADDMGHVIEIED